MNVLLAHNPAMLFEVKLERLAEARRLDRMAVYEAIRSMGWRGSKATVHNYFAGKTRPDMDAALMLARVLGVPLDYLADDAQDEPPVASPDDGLAADERAVLAFYRVRKQIEGEKFTPEVLGYRVEIGAHRPIEPTMQGGAGAGNATGAVKPRQAPAAIE